MLSIKKLTHLENAVIGPILTPINYLKKFNFAVLGNLLFPEKNKTNSHNLVTFKAFNLVYFY